MVIALFLQGCGLKFWYNRLDWVVPWYVDDFVELTSSQEEQLEQLMVSKTRWHRTSELPKYIEWVDKLASDIESETVEQNYDLHRKQIQGFFSTLLNEVGIDVVMMMTELTDSQVTELIDTLEEEDADYMEEYKDESEEERVDQRKENLKDSLEEWVGRLSKEQRAIVREWAKNIKGTTEARMAYRESWRAELKRILAYRETEDGKKQLQDLFKNFDQYRTPELRALYEHNNALTRENLIRLSKTMSEKQKKKMIERLNNYKEDFSDLLADAEE
ncbi:DUF6279 family lipoprotein [Pleionea sediminis]|uniref:DUF6279 family lipoprotein n=1 Tax=Pleionea sediminis TaxID=2569479 RepID=UPI0011851847|nr:DUF6279 family lipoprotein [Pleionea sediminis]